MPLTAREKLALLLNEDEVPVRVEDPKPTPLNRGLQPVKPLPVPEDMNHGLSKAELEYWEQESDQEDDYQRNTNAHLQEPFNPPTITELAAVIGNDQPHEQPPRGTMVATGETFCPIIAISKLPYKYVRKDLMQPVASSFFDQQKFWRYFWEVCYIWPLFSSEPLLLVSTYQVHCLLDSINKEVPNAKLSLDEIDSRHEIVLKFDDPHPRLRPRFLGICSSQDDLNRLKASMPTSTYKPETEKRDTTPPSEKSKQWFMKLVQNGLDSGRAKKSKNKNISKEVSQYRETGAAQNWAGHLRQAERFLGLRAAHVPGEAAEDEAWSQTLARDTARHDASHPPPIDPSQPPPHPFDSEPVFIAIDVECYERPPRQITEVGISILDTRNLSGQPPGDYGSTWRSKIRSRHFRIQEWAHLQNGEFVQGAADDFRFGSSEFIPQVDAPRIVATCFRPPFEKVTGEADDTEPASQEDALRTLVLVGHDFQNDRSYLRRLGYDVGNLSTLHKHTPMLDTQHFHRVMNNAKDNVSLAKILAEIDVDPWGLHNAGNDARYTLEALLGMCVDRAGRGRAEKLRGKEKAVGVEKAKGAQLTAKAETEVAEEGGGVRLEKHDAGTLTPADMPPKRQRSEKEVFEGMFGDDD